MGSWLLINAEGEENEDAVIPLPKRGWKTACKKFGCPEAVEVEDDEDDEIEEEDADDGEIFDWGDVDMLNAANLDDRELVDGDLIEGGEDEEEEIEEEEEEEEEEEAQAVVETVS